MRQTATRAGKGHNLNYGEGFDREAQAFEKHKGLIEIIGGFSDIQIYTRGHADTKASIDAVAEKEGSAIAVSLRFRDWSRGKDYNTFTASRHLTDKHNELSKWTASEDVMRPSYYVQICELPTGDIRAICVNFKIIRPILQELIDTGEIDQYYNSRLGAYEFPCADFSHGIINQVIDSPE